MWIFNRATEAINYSVRAVLTKNEAGASCVFTTPYCKLSITHICLNYIGCTAAVAAELDLNAFQ